MTQTLRTITHRIAGADGAGGSLRSGLVFDPATGVPQAEVALAVNAEGLVIVVGSIEAASERATWQG